MKVKVGSQQAVVALEDRVASAAEKYSETKDQWSRATRRVFKNHMTKAAKLGFNVLHRNVSVNGADWDYNVKEDDVEPRDRQLLAQLQATQLEVYELTERVAALRRDVPAQLAEIYQTMAGVDLTVGGDADAAVGHVSSADTSASSSNPVPEAVVQQLGDTIAALKRLTKKLPQKVNALEELQETAKTMESIHSSETFQAIAAQKPFQ